MHRLLTLVASVLWITGSRAEAQQWWHTGLGALWHMGVSHGIWDLPGSEMDLMSPALAGRFFTAGPLGKPLSVLCVVACMCPSHTLIYFSLLSLFPLVTAGLFSISVILFLFCMYIHLYYLLGSTHK